jgi:AcrR family transcriptional regulator
MAENRTRERIMEAALPCFLEEGYERTTIARIRECSGVSNGALFHHFPSKEAIADALYVEAMASFQAGLQELIRRKPRTLRAAVRGTITHQLRWIEEHAELARFVYLRGHLDWDSLAAGEVERLNRDLASEVHAWMAPLVEAGEVRPFSTVMMSAIVAGPTHAIAQRWLAGQVTAKPISFADELIDAACAALGGTATRPRRVRAESAPVGRVAFELIADDGSVLAHGQATAELESP